MATEKDICIQKVYRHTNKYVGVNVKVVVLFFCIIASVITKSEGSENELELQLVQVLFRHGDRNPVDPYPTDPYKNESFWPEGYAQLTKRGKQQHYKLGKYFRKRYDGYLSSKYSPYEIYVQASDVDRTLMSAEANLAGLYPPQDAQSLWNPNLQWQPIPVHTQPNVTDNKLRMSAPCPRLKQAMEEYNQSPYMQQIYKDNQELLQYLSEHIGKPVRTVQDVDYLYDDLHIESLYNYTLPDWTKKVFPGGPFYDLMALSFKVMTATVEMQRLRVGPLLREMVENFQSRLNNTLDARRKFFMYSAHDTTVSSLLNTLEIFTGIPPPYASAIILEMHKNTTSGNSCVKVLFKNESDSEAYVMTLPGCKSSMCEFNDFLEFTRPKIPENWEAECKCGFLGLTGFSLGVLIVGTFLFIVLLGCLLVMTCVKRRNKTEKPAYPYLHLQMEDEDA